MPYIFGTFKFTLQMESLFWKVSCLSLWNPLFFIKVPEITHKYAFPMQQACHFISLIITLAPWLWNCLGLSFSHKTYTTPLFTGTHFPPPMSPVCFLLVDSWQTLFSPLCIFFLSLDHSGQGKNSTNTSTPLMLLLMMKKTARKS